MNERVFKIERDPYEEKKYIFKRKTITIKSGLTVLVGCNGSGKTTLLQILKEKLDDEEIPVIYYDNLHDGGLNSLGKSMLYGDTAFAATAFCSSEGENICLNMNMLAEKIGRFVRSHGESTGDRIEKIIKALEKVNGEEKEFCNSSNEIWILLDAIDSGLSIDNIVELKEELFKTILDNNYGHDIYIIVSANEYEMCNGENCFDAQAGKYININDYEDFKKAVLKSREYKNNLYKK